MNNTKIYTAQEMRSKASEIVEQLGDSSVTAAMLRYAADVVERCDNVLKANARGLKYRHKDADAALAYANYILRGDAGKEGK